MCSARKPTSTGKRRALPTLALASSKWLIRLAQPAGVWGEFIVLHNAGGAYTDDTVFLNQEPLRVFMMLLSMRCFSGSNSLKFLKNAR